ncbi:MAG: hypothetical protein LAO78_23785 [Acidobacteriia bacterium]|nr:hypothetical protein [Terriglobia bacterium]
MQKQKPAATKLLGGALPTQKMLEYLAADYGVCIAIAMAITHSDQTAEEVVSECTASAVEQIQAGKVRADNAEKFHAWLHTIVRRNAMRRAGQSESTFVEYVEQGTSVDFGCTEFDHARVWGTGKGMPHAE